MNYFTPGTRVLKSLNQYTTCCSIYNSEYCTSDSPAHSTIIIIFMKHPSTVQTLHKYRFLGEPYDCGMQHCDRGRGTSILGCQSIYTGVPVQPRAQTQSQNMGSFRDASPANCISLDGRRKTTELG